MWWNSRRKSITSETNTTQEDRRRSKKSRRVLAIAFQKLPFPFHQILTERQLCKYKMVTHIIRYSVEFNIPLKVFNHFRQRIKTRLSGGINTQSYIRLCSDQERSQWDFFVAFGIKKWIYRQCCYQPDCSSDPRRWFCNAVWSWKANLLCFMKDLFMLCLICWLPSSFLFSIFHF